MLQSTFNTEIKTIHSIIQQLRNSKPISENNYEYKDITILLNSRKRVSLVIEFLSENGMNVVSNEGLLIHSSEKVRLVVDVLRYLIDINDDISKLSIINYLNIKNQNLKIYIFFI